MWPPSSEDSLLARSTIAIAFQRIIERTRRSSCSSTGYSGSRCGGIVLRYGDVPAGIGAAPVIWAWPTTRSSRCWARSGPSWSKTASSASSHSRVSWGSMSCLSMPAFPSGPVLSVVHRPHGLHLPIGGPPRITRLSERGAARHPRAQTRARRVVSAIAAALALAASGCGSAASQAARPVMATAVGAARPCAARACTPPASVPDRRFTRLRIPPSARGHRAPLVLALHFASGTGEQTELVSRLTPPGASLGLRRGLSDRRRRQLVVDRRRWGGRADDRDDRAQRLHRPGARLRGRHLQRRLHVDRCSPAASPAGSRRRAVRSRRRRDRTV